MPIFDASGISEEFETELSGGRGGDAKHETDIKRAVSQEAGTSPGLFLVCSAVQIAFLNSITMPQLLMTPVITAAMSKLIKVVGSLSHFHVEARVAQRRFPIIAAAELPFG